MADGNGEKVVIVSAALMVRANALVAVTWLLSVNCTVKFEVPEAAGIPLICPIIEFSERPEGKAPTLTFQVYCPVPPVAVSVCK